MSGNLQNVQTKEVTKLGNNIPKRLPLTSDYVFKRVFAKEENNSMLKDLLEAILDRKINKVVVKNPEVSSKLEQWLWLLAGESEEKIKMAMEKNEEVKKTVEVLDELSQNEQERYLYESRLIAEISYNSEIDYAREEGKEIGRCEGEKLGEKKKSVEIAKELLKEGMSKEKIAKIVNMTIEELEKL